jgi:hypothetical protein
VLNVLERIEALAFVDYDFDRKNADETQRMARKWGADEIAKRRRQCMIRMQATARAMRDPLFGHPHAASCVVPE